MKLATQIILLILGVMFSLMTMSTKESTTIVGTPNKPKTGYLFAFSALGAFVLLIITLFIH